MHCIFPLKQKLRKEFVVDTLESTLKDFVTKVGHHDVLFRCSGAFPLRLR